jgi:hypothetical protein
MFRGMPGFDGKEEFTVGKVFGIRSWGIYDSKLIGNFGGIWVPDENTAECWSGMSHQPPDENCGCGFWAYWDRRSARFTEIVGVIEGYGHTLIGPYGFRCQRARIIALATPDGIEASDYHVPVYHSIDEMLKNHPLTEEYYEELGNPHTTGSAWVSFASTYATSNGNWGGSNGTTVTGGYGGSGGTSFSTSGCIGSGSGGGGGGWGSSYFIPDITRSQNEEE